MASKDEIRRRFLILRPGEEIRFLDLPPAEEIAAAGFEPGRVVDLKYHAFSIDPADLKRGGFRISVGGIARRADADEPEVEIVETLAIPDDRDRSYREVFDDLSRRAMKTGIPIMLIEGDGKTRPRSGPVLAPVELTPEAIDRAKRAFARFGRGRTRGK